MYNTFTWYLKRILQQVAYAALLAMIALPVKAAPAISKRYQIVSGILLQLTSFTTWKNNQTKVVTLCLFGDDPFGQYIDDMLKRQPKNRAGQSIKIKRVTNANAFPIAQCNIVYTEPQNLTRMWQQLPVKHNILLVSQDQDFINQGGMVNFAYQNKRVKLEISLPAVHHAELKMSSALLKHALIVKGQPRKKFD